MGDKGGLDLSGLIRQCMLCDIGERWSQRGGQRGAFGFTGSLAEGVSGNLRFTPSGRPRLRGLILIVRGIVRGIELKVEQLVCGNQIHSDYNGCVGVYVPAGSPGKWRGLRAWRRLAI